VVPNSITASADKTPLSPYSYTRILPVLPSELPKFFALSFMMFWIIYIFTIARDTKDALIVTNCGAEAIAFLKVYGVVPAATAFMFGYAYLANHFSPRALFYITITPFMLFYAVFAFVLYPMRHVLHPMGWKVPEGGMSFAVNLLRHWTFSLYYIVSELWGSAGVPLLFWSCANDVIRIDQAKRIYPLIALLGNLGPIFSGITMTLVSRYVSRYISIGSVGMPGGTGDSIVGNDERAFEVSLKVLAVLTTIAGASVCALYNLVHRLNDADIKVEQDRDLNSERMNEMKSNRPHLSSKSVVATCHVSKATTSTSVPQPTTTTTTSFPIRKPSLSLSQSLAVLAQSPYLRHVASMVLSYGLSMEFTEILWKSSVKAAFPIKTDYLQFMGRYSTLVGCTAFVMMFVGSSVVDALGWRAGALVTPVMMGVLALPFFGCVIFGRLSKDTLLPAVYIGLAQNVLTGQQRQCNNRPQRRGCHPDVRRDCAQWEPFSAKSCFGWLPYACVHWNASCGSDPKHRAQQQRIRSSSDHRNYC